MDALMLDLIPIAMIAIFVDLAIIGFIPKIMGIHASMRSIRDKVDISEYVCCIRFDTGARSINLRINFVTGVKLVLAGDFIYFQNTLLTYVYRINLSDIETISVESGVVAEFLSDFRDSVVIFLRSGRKLSFRSRDGRLWKKCLECKLSDRGGGVDL
jgi:hypothetical protein